MGTLSRFITVLLALRWMVQGQTFVPSSPLNRTAEGRALFFKDRGVFRGHKYLVWAKKWYQDAMKRIDKQIADDEQDDNDGDSQLRAFCLKGEKATRDVCRIFGSESESCKVVTTEFRQKCIPGSGSDPFFFVWFCTQQLYAATELAPNDDSLFYDAGEMGLNLHRSPDGPVIFLKQALGYMSRACSLKKAHCKKLGNMLTEYYRGDRIGNLRPGGEQMIRQQIRGLQAMHNSKYSDCCDERQPNTAK